jgi:hypothetical protein
VVAARQSGVVTSKAALLYKALVLSCAESAYCCISYTPTQHRWSSQAKAGACRRERTTCCQKDAPSSLNRRRIGLWRSWALCLRMMRATGLLHQQAGISRTQHSTSTALHARSPSTTVTTRLGEQRGPAGLQQTLGSKCTMTTRERWLYTSRGHSSDRCPARSGRSVEPGWHQKKVCLDLFASRAAFVREPLK